MNNIWKSSFQTTERIFKCKFHQTRFGLAANDNIFALSTSPGKAGIAVIRISGTQARNVLDLMTARNQNIKKPSFIPRKATLTKIINPIDKFDVLDIGIVLWFPGPSSYTGEDMVELHVHGGNAVVGNILESLSTLEHYRMAEPGEFSQRAFYNNKLDLTEIEGISDLINAETKAQRKQALNQAQGVLRNLYEQWRSQIIKAMANIEAIIDFSEEESLETNMYEIACEIVQKITNEMKLHTSDDRGELVRNAKRKVAIVSPTPGTTRDVLETSINLAGFQAIVSDTAGIRKAKNDIEKQGIQLAIQKALDADIRILVLDSSDLDKSFTKWWETSKKLFEPIYPKLQNNGNALGFHEFLLDKNTFLVFNKADKIVNPNMYEMLMSLESKINGQKNLHYKNFDDVLNKCWSISCTTESGFQNWVDGISQVVKKKLEDSAMEPAYLTRERHRQLLNVAIKHLEIFMDMDETRVVECAEELRMAANNIGKVTGRVDTQDVLDEIFSQFCIGK
ncbi:hypothetical protein BB559_005038 [Furculomyces boomerangus]|uniref:TrmE-type G domain-containing protein n=1 Tax=Furculomyces boomerangus TaxID=61424 RepID=A0A2T9YB33_9FUNG|nr:hypothetical protein BB559_005038 [Furculomyces boomerangus]